MARNEDWEPIMTARKMLLRALMFSALCLPVAANADDTDIYVGGEKATGAQTNVLIVLDNSANWSNAAGWSSTQGEAELAALKKVIDTLDETINVGVMMHAPQGSGYVRFAVRKMGVTERGALLKNFNDIMSTAPTAPQDKVSQSANGDNLMEEVFRYFNGKARVNAANTDSKQDYPGNTEYYLTTAGGGVSAELQAAPHPAASLAPHAYASLGASDYTAPADAALGCAKNYVIWVGNTYLSGQGSSARLAAAGSLIGVTADTTVIPGDAAITDRWADEWARFMRFYGVKTGLLDKKGNPIYNNIRTYTVDVYPPQPAQCDADPTAAGCQEGASQSDQHKILKSVASAGGGKYFAASNTSDLERSLRLIFAEIQTVNSVFASATLPVSVNTQGTFENQIYIGVFRPDGNARPRWLGNLKEYKFARWCDTNNDDVVDPEEPKFDDTVRSPVCTNPDPTKPAPLLKLYLADRFNKPAIDDKNNTGFIDLEATSFWTQPSTFWNFYPIPSALGSDAPDGPTVERGGAAYKLRQQYAGGRNVFTCGTNCLAPTATADQRTLGNNPFAVSNSSVVNKLQVSGVVAVNYLWRYGNKVVAYAPNHGFVDGDLVTISGVTAPVEFNGTFSVTRGPWTPLNDYFLFTLAESPKLATGDCYIDTAPCISDFWYNPQPTAGGWLPVNVSKASTQLSVSSLTVDPVLLTATATLTSGHTIGSGDKISFTGATQSFLQGDQIVSSVTGSSVTFPISPTFPATPATTVGTSTAGTSPGLANVLVRRAVSRPHLVQVLVNVTTNPQQLNSQFYAIGLPVRLNAVVPSEYNGTWIISGIGSDCDVDNNLTAAQRKLTYCFSYLRSPDPGVDIKVSTITAPLAGYLFRHVWLYDYSEYPAALYSYAIIAVPQETSGGLSNETKLAITGSIAEPAYNGQWPVSNLFVNPLNPVNGWRLFQISRIPVKPFPTFYEKQSQAIKSGSDTTTGQSLVDWVRGTDLFEDENQNGVKSDVRASIHADVLHSRPLMINYGGATGIVGFYGSNDGMLHAVKGGITDADGGEKWAFIPDEFINRTKLLRLYRNTPIVRYPNLQCDLGALPRNYFWDGLLTAYQGPVPATSTNAADRKVYLFAGMRRGGRSYYAFDVTNPDAPLFLWRINGDQGGDFAMLGQTWSEPRVIKIKGTKVVDGAPVDDVRVVLAFGAGYDDVDDDKPAGSVRGNRTGGVGYGVFLVDAFTGARLNLLSPPAGVRNYSIPADVSAVDVNGDGYIERLYAVDTGGDIFRFELDESAAPGTLKHAIHVARLGDVDVDGGADARKFMFGPSVVPFTKDGKTAMNILVGSGDREKPLANRTDSALTCAAPPSGTAGGYYTDTYYGKPVKDRFYAVIDDLDLSADAATAAQQVADANTVPVLEADLHEVNATPDSLSRFELTSGKKGWYVTLRTDTDADATTWDEEKTVNAPRVVTGVVFFGTNTPQKPDTSKGICSNLGVAQGYAIDPFSGMPVFNRDGSVDASGNSTFSQNDYAAVYDGAGLPPTVTAGPVDIGGDRYRFLIGGGGTGKESKSAVQATRVDAPLSGTRTKVYWYYQAEDK